MSIQNHYIESLIDRYVIIDELINEKLRNTELMILVPAKYFIEQVAPYIRSFVHGLRLPLLKSIRTIQFLTNLFADLLSYCDAGVFTITDVTLMSVIIDNYRLVTPEVVHDAFMYMISDGPIKMRENPECIRKAFCTLLRDVVSTDLTVILPKDVAVATINAVISILMQYGSNEGVRENREAYSQLLNLHTPIIAWSIYTMSLIDCDFKETIDYLNQLLKKLTGEKS